MTEYYKATRPDGTDFYSGTIDYARALETGEIVRHPTTRRVKDRPETYLSVSVAEADCTGFRWPCRLFRVEPIGKVMDGLSANPNKRAVKALRVAEELPAWRAFGPNGERLVVFLDRIGVMTASQAHNLSAARDAARDAARVAAWVAARDAARDAAWAAARDAARAAAWVAARDAAWDAAAAILADDLITPGHYDTLVRPFHESGLGDWVARPAEVA